MDHFLMKLLKFPGVLILRALAKYTKKHNWLPNWAFHEVEHVAPSAELWVLKETDRGTEIFLVKRPASDPYWPNKWHSPGTIGKITDTYERVFKRLAEELGETELPGKPELLTTDIAINDARDTTVHIFHTVHVNKDVKFSTGEFHPINNLPQPFMDFQEKQINRLKNELKNKA